MVLVDPQDARHFKTYGFKFQDGRSEELERKWSHDKKPFEHRKPNSDKTKYLESKLKTKTYLN